MIKQRWFLFASQVRSKILLGQGWQQSPTWSLLDQRSRINNNFNFFLFQFISTSRFLAHTSILILPYGSFKPEFELVTFKTASSVKIFTRSCFSFSFINQSHVYCRISIIELLRHKIETSWQIYFSKLRQEQFLLRLDNRGRWWGGRSSLARFVCCWKYQNYHDHCWHYT